MKILRETMAVRARLLVAGTIAAALWPEMALGTGPSVDVIPNFVGVGAGVTTQWMGAKDKIAGIMPAGRIEFSQHRFVEVYGPIADVNLLNVPNWEFGPMLSYRFGRKDVADPVVNALPPIDGGWEAGGFVGYHYTNTQGVPWRLRVGVAVTTAIGADAAGSHVTPYTSLWVPLHRKVFLGLGAGLTWSSSSFMQQRFGVTPGASNASGLPVFSADAGVRQVYAWPAVIVQVTEHWFAATGMFYQRLTNDASSSPIVTERGDANQFTAGAGVGYAWR